CRRGPRLTLEAFERLCILGDVVRQELERDEAAELGILGFVNHTHPAAAQLLQDVVMRDCLVEHATRGESNGIGSGRASQSWAGGVGESIDDKFRYLIDVCGA